jgi:hypothetical protein
MIPGIQNCKRKGTSFRVFLFCFCINPASKKACDFPKTKKDSLLSPAAFTFIRGLVGIRTPNLLIRSEMLYPVELQNQRALKALQR